MGIEKGLVSEDVIAGAQTQVPDLLPEEAATAPVQKRFSRGERRGRDPQITRLRGVDEVLGHLGVEQPGDKKQVEAFIGSLGIPDMAEDNRLGPTDRRQTPDRREDPLPEAVGIPPIV